MQKTKFIDSPTGRQYVSQTHKPAVHFKHVRFGKSNQANQIDLYCESSESSKLIIDSLSELDEYYKYRNQYSPNSCESDKY